MSTNIEVDFLEMEKKLKCYVDKSNFASAVEVKEAPTFSVKPDVSLIKPLKKMNVFEEVSWRSIVQLEL